jgi:hypothetical protein
LAKRASHQLRDALAATSCACRSGGSSSPHFSHVHVTGCEAIASGREKCGRGKLLLRPFVGCAPLLPLSCAGQARQLGCQASAGP